MLISCVSDLHLRYNRMIRKQILRKITSCPADVLIIAGDTEGDSNFWRAMSDSFKDVIFILGNHDFYGTSRERALAEAYGIEARHPNVHFLENSSVVLGDQKFLGCTLWFDGITRSAALNDFNFIEDFDWYRRVNDESKNYLKTVSSDDIVITHHLPSFELVNSRFKDSYLNMYFVCDILVKNKMCPKIWFCGHTHTNIDMYLNSTRCYCNPFGYGTENLGFNPETISI